MADIDTKHPQYLKSIEAWCLMRDAFDGEDTVKDAGVKYLPLKSGMVAISDLNDRNEAYKNYKLRAEFPELLAPTVRGTAGIIVEKEPKFELPAGMEYLLEDATGDGTTLDVLYSRMVNELMTTGRYGLLPGLNDDNTFNIIGYKAEQIINWDTDGRRLSYTVLDESGDERDANGAWRQVSRHLELQLEGGRYIATKYENGIAQDDPIEGRNPRGEALNKVPFVFVGTMDLTPEPDDIPLYGLAKIAMRIYRMDADYTWSLHLTSEPTPWVNGFDDAKGAIERGEVPSSIGAANLWVLPTGASAGFLEFTGPGVAAQESAIAKSLERAVMFGAQTLSENTSSGESGESRRLRLRNQRSVLISVAKMAAAGMERALRNIAEWGGFEADKVMVTPNLDFSEYTIDAQKLTAMVAGWQAGAYSKQTLFDNLKRADMVPAGRTFEDEQEYINGDPPLGTIT